MSLDTSKKYVKPKNVTGIPGKEALKAEKPKEISMTDLIKAQRKIDQNSANAGVVKPLISRPRTKDKLPLANK